MLKKYKMYRKTSYNLKKSYNLVETELKKVQKQITVSIL